MKASVPGSAGTDKKLIVASKHDGTSEYYSVSLSYNPADIVTESPTVQMVLMRTTALSSPTLATFITNTSAAMRTTVLTRPRYPSLFILVEIFVF